MSFRREENAKIRFATLCVVSFLTFLFLFLSPGLSLSAGPADVIPRSALASVSAPATEAPNAQAIYYTTRIQSHGLWEEAGPAPRPQLLTLRLYADGTEVAARSVTGSLSNWEIDFGEFATYRSGVPIRYTLRSDPVDDYILSITPTSSQGVLAYRVTGTHKDVVRSHRTLASLATGDESRTFLWGSCFLLSLFALAILLLHRRGAGRRLF